MVINGTKLQAMEMGLQPLKSALAGLVPIAFEDPVWVPLLTEKLH